MANLIPMLSTSPPLFEPPLDTHDLSADEGEDEFGCFSTGAVALFKDTADEASNTPITVKQSTNLTAVSSGFTTPVGTFLSECNRETPSPNKGSLQRIDDVIEHNQLAADGVEHVNLKIDLIENSLPPDIVESDFADFSGPQLADSGEFGRLDINLEESTIICENSGIGPIHEIDEFGDFESSIPENGIVSVCDKIVIEDEPPSEDKFGDFEMSEFSANQNAATDNNATDSTCKTNCDFGAYEASAFSSVSDGPTESAGSAAKVTSDFLLESNDDFGAFETTDFSRLSASQSDNVNRAGKVVPDRVPDSNDDFGDFESPVAPQTFPEFGSTVQQNKAFGEAPLSSSVLEGQDDDFGDFAEFESAPSSTSHSRRDSNLQDDGSAKTEGAYLNATVYRIIDVVFTPFVADELSGTEGVIVDDIIMNDSEFQHNIPDRLFSHLRDIENTKALTFQWAVSHASRRMLYSLNIDARNVLYGARWNSQMPLYAATLNWSPLEPSKFNQQGLGLNDQRSDKLANQDVPSVQFDWNGSGLVNPLDCLESELLGSPTEKGGKRNNNQSIFDQIISSSANRSVSTLQPARGSISCSSGFDFNSDCSRRPRNLSNEAKAILDRLPDMSFMRASMLMFPIRSKMEDRL